MEMDNLILVGGYVDTSDMAMCMNLDMCMSDIWICTFIRGMDLHIGYGYGWIWAWTYGQFDIGRWIWKLICGYVSIMMAVDMNLDMGM